MKNSYIVGVTENLEADTVEEAVELYLSNFRNRDVVHVEVLDTLTDQVTVVDAKFVAEVEDTDVARLGRTYGGLNEDSNIQVSDPTGTD